MKTQELILWGERGLVASLLLDVGQSKSTAGWESFLRGTTFAQQDWALGGVTSTTTVVEPDFSNDGFGHPDAVIRLNLAGGDSVVLILEAKRFPYGKCCIPPSNREGAGYNSKLNGQLELNHCLALALSEFKAEERELIEPKWILNTPYGVERRGRRRSLKNRVVIQEVASMFAGLPFRSYYHLIITADDSNPFDNLENGPLFPELFHPDFPFENCWEDLKSQFGWTSWERMAKVVKGFVGAGDLAGGSLFLPTYEKNKRNFGVGRQIEPSREDPSKSAEIADATAAPEFIPQPFGRNRRGVSMINAPSINPDTYLHFSWLGESCALRDYSKSPTIMPFEKRDRKTSDVTRDGVIKDEVQIRNRRPISDITIWHEITQNLNRNLQRVLQPDEVVAENGR